MKYPSIFTALLVFSLAQSAYANTPDVKLDTEEKRISYFLGVNLAQGLPQDRITLDPQSVAAGIYDVINSGKPRLSEEELKAAIESFTARMEQFKQQQQEAMKGLADSNRMAGEEFLKSNAKKDGVKVTDSGLQYKIVQAGSGKKPAVTDSVSVHYRGTLINGEEFDSSYKRGEPVTFPLQGVIPGWTEVLQLMPVGSKWEVYIPANLAYGPRATGKIGPESTLIFEIELLEIK
jgi:FKBP-type peptidyl-prolyl cis-trans isomerase